MMLIISKFLQIDVFHFCFLCKIKIFKSSLNVKLLKLRCLFNFRNLHNMDVQQRKFIVLLISLNYFTSLNMKVGMSLMWF